MEATCCCISLANLKRVCVRANLQLQANYDVGIYTEWQNVMNRKKVRCVGLMRGRSAEPQLLHQLGALLLPSSPSFLPNKLLLKIVRLSSAHLSPQNMFTHISCVSPAPALLVALRLLLFLHLFHILFFFLIIN